MNYLKVTWIDAGREPQCPPNPRYPEGIDLDTTLGNKQTCSTQLPYPAKRCGYFVVECSMCNQRIIVTTAGRPDDPRSIKVACLRAEGVAQ